MITHNAEAAIAFIEAHLTEFVDNEDYSLVFDVTNYSARIDLFVRENGDTAAARRAIGTMEKHQSEYSGLYLTRRIENADGTRLHITLHPPNDTCKRVQVGTRVVKKPDPNIEVPEIEVEEPVYEWECKEINGG